MTHKLVYLYNEATGEYVGEYAAPLSPLEPNVYHTPTHRTLIAPEHSVDQASFWNGESWAIVSDHRGKTIYDRAGDTHVVSDVGDLTEDYAFEPFPPTEAEIEAARIATIRNEYANKRLQPFAFDGETYVADNDFATMVNEVIGQYQHIPLPDDFYLKTANGDRVPFDSDSLRKLYAAIMSRNWLLEKQLDDLCGNIQQTYEV